MESTHHSAHGTSDRPYGVRNRSGYAPWLLGLALMLAASVPFYAEVNQINRAYMTGNASLPHVADTLAFQGHQYLVTGPAETLADNQLRLIGRAEDGRNVYASNLPGGGGGIAGTTARHARVYVKTGPNRYLPMDAK